MRLYHTDHSKAVVADDVSTASDLNAYHSQNLVVMWTAVNNWKRENMKPQNPSYRNNGIKMLSTILP